MVKQLIDRLYLVEATWGWELRTPKPSGKGFHPISVDPHKMRIIAYELLAHAERIDAHKDKAAKNP